MLKERLYAQGMIDLLQAQEAKGEHVAEIFKSYLHAVFPHMKSEQQSKDEEMKKVMQREVQKGVITFQPAAETFLQKKAKTMQLPDDFKQKLAAKRARG